MAEIRAGLQGTEEMVVQREHLASALGNIGAEVLSTHWVVLLMERAARKTLEGLIPDGSAPGSPSPILRPPLSG